VKLAYGSSYDAKLPDPLGSSGSNYVARNETPNGGFKNGMKPPALQLHFTFG